MVDRTQTQEKIQVRDVLRACRGAPLGWEGGRGAHEGVNEIVALLSGREGSS